MHEMSVSRVLLRQTVNLAKASLLLHEIKANNTRLDLVLELQRFLIRRITQCERRIGRLSRVASRLRKSVKHDRLPKERSNLLKTRVELAKELVESLQHLMFVWRCFGDGIAAIYQSKYSLKHLFFDANYRPKEGAGHMTGKKGFRKEWKFLKLGIKMGVPVLLADVTNIIRHGDLCALADPDPLLVEVKSSGNRNARTARQFSQLDELASFFANDGAASFRGMNDVRRVAVRIPEVNHFEAVNECISDALTHGSASVEPEPGLRYVAFFDDPGDRLASLKSPTMQGYLLSASPTWLPAYPFSLSLEPANLIRFLLRQVLVMVIVDLAYLKRLFADQGVHATMLMEGEFAIQVATDPEDLSLGVFKISDQRFARIAPEFQSLRWFAKEMAAAMEDFLPRKLSAEEQELMNQGLLMLSPTPSEWTTVRDCFGTS